MGNMFPTFAHVPLTNSIPLSSQCGYIFKNKRKLLLFIAFIFFFLLLHTKSLLNLKLDYDDFGRNEFSFGNQPGQNGVDREASVLSKLGSSSTAELHPKAIPHGESKATAMPPASVMTRLILIMVWRKLIRNPNTYSSLIGLTWSLVSFKYI